MERYEYKIMPAKEAEGRMEFYAGHFVPDGEPGPEWEEMGLHFTEGRGWYCTWRRALARARGGATVSKLTRSEVETMSARKWTPGPWKVTPEREYLFVRSGSRMLAQVFVRATISSPPERSDFEENDANAHLIAAAPSLAEALEGLRDWIIAVEPIVDDEGLDAMRKARAALALAKGEG